MPQTQYYILFASLLCITFSWIQSKKNKNRSPLPPSPRPDPLIGHLRTLMSVSDEPRAYSNWGKELGSDIISITLPPGNTIIVLNSVEAADELLVKRSSIYSDRPQVPMLSSKNLTGWGNATSILGYGERWRSQRRMTHDAFQKKASEELRPIISRELRLGLQRIASSPGTFATEIKRMTGSSILTAVYGYEATSANDPLVEVVETAVAGFCQAAIVSNFYVNVMPWLEYVPEWFPGADWKRKTNKWRAELEVMLNTPYEWTRSRVATGNAPPSMLTRLLTGGASDKSEEELDHIRWATGTLFGAGSDTTTAAALIFIMAMVMHPEVQTRAQDEIDAVLGGTRLPEIADRESMPYMQAIAKEVLRWKPVAPSAVPHACIKDDIYRGYRIPRGATVVANIWAMSNDESVYPNPEKFDPERFLDSSVPDAPSFGFGRRVCPGIHFAEDSVFLIATGLLSVFDIRPAHDAEGNPIQLTGETLRNALVSQPLPFDCDIKLRSERHEKLLREWVDG